MSINKSHPIHKLSLAGLMITLGIIYGDIGTSPLYVMKAIIGQRTITDELVLGGLSCVLWTLTLQTTFKYVFITLRADNKGEGGIFSLFALIRRRNPKLIWAAIIGGGTLLADGMITPPISVSSAIEGLQIFKPELNTVPIVIAIISALFIFQKFGAKAVGNFFGPIMFIWFAMLAVVGFNEVIQNLSVIKALNPYYAYNLLCNHPGGFWLLGAVFLCTTGAEALYSDLGHCGRKNIRVSWIFVKFALVINYMGQSAWILKHDGQLLNGVNPFYQIIPEWFLIYGIAIATLAAIIASQAMISGSYTLISEAIRLNLWPKVKIHYPTLTKGQLYIPSINWVLFLGCLGVILYFRHSEEMEAAYGLAISLTMLMTTVLLTYYLKSIKKLNRFIVYTFFFTFLFIEVAFLIANLEKFSKGGYVTLVIGGALMTVMYVWYQARKIKNRLTEFVPLEEYFPLIKELSRDTSVNKYATHVVYLTSADSIKDIESKVIYSIFQKQPKRADIYWLLHIDVVDEPYAMEYKVNTILPDDLIRIDFKLGFRIEPRVNLFFRKVVEDMVQNKEVDFTSRYTSLSKRNLIGDFKFVVLEKHLSHDNDLPWKEQFIMDIYFILRRMSLSETSAFGLDTSTVTVEKVPLVIAPVAGVNLKRVH
ncbi:MAG TPA: KUP/HAK/KT family potassium transporter [Cytophagaceae bacterium]|jgi:KUP system potassium uptake protein|nr:KUP/HAK/KT family potassium transporter [Cytophagaceae bacterium]